MKERKTIKSPGAFQLLADETRLKMIYLLRAKEMTVSQMAAELGLTPQTIYHHIKKLREAEMVEVSREERIDHLVESYYRATAGFFYFVHGGCGKDWEGPEVIANALNALGRMGHEVDANSEGVAKILKLMESLRRTRENPEVMEKAYQMDDIDPFTQEVLIEFAVMMEMDDRQFEKYLDTHRTLREWLLSQRKESR